MTSGKPASDAQPMPSAKPGIRWIERQRATTLDVQRYTRFVAIMRRALPMAAAALLAAVVAYSLQPRLQDSRKIAVTMRNIGILTNDLMMLKPRLTGVDGDGNPYVVTAERAIQDPHDSKRAQLQKVEADVTLKKGDWVNLTATRGFLDTQKQKLWLAGIIDVYSDNGYEAHTTAAAIDMETGIVTGDKYVTGQGAFGTFTADKFRIDHGAESTSKSQSKAGKKRPAKSDKTIIHLYGNVHMTLLKHGAAHS